MAKKIRELSADEKRFALVLANMVQGLTEQGMTYKQAVKIAQDIFNLVVNRRIP